jgi:hypothetical protein
MVGYVRSHPEHSKALNPFTWYKKERDTWEQSKRTVQRRLTLGEHLSFTTLHLQRTPFDFTKYCGTVHKPLLGVLVYYMYLGLIKVLIAYLVLVFRSNLNHLFIYLLQLKKLIIRINKIIQIKPFQFSSKVNQKKKLIENNL